MGGSGNGAVAASEGDEQPDLLGALLRAVSHDLRNPQLTLSLSVELVLEALPEGDSRLAVAREGLTTGLRDLERMLDAVSLVSRARRRPLQSDPVALEDVIGTHAVHADGVDAASLLVRVDPRPVGDALEAVGPSADARLAVSDGQACLSLALPEEPPVPDGAPLLALLESLSQYAGTAVGRLAAVQVQVERQGARLYLERGRATLCLPLVERAPR